MDAQAGDAEEAGAPAGKWVRKPAVARRAEIVAKAREVFAAQGFADSGLAEVASAAQVSKSLLYHYFPGGRPQLFVSVIEELLEELLGELRHAAKVPFSAKTRITHLLSAIFRFFDQKPDAYRLLFQDPTVSHDAAVEAAALTIRAQIAGELASLLAESSMSPDDVVSASAGILGFTLSNVELCIAGRIEPEHAWQVTCRFCTSSL